MSITINCSKRIQSNQGNLGFWYFKAIQSKTIIANVFINGQDNIIFDEIAEWPNANTNAAATPTNAKQKTCKLFFPDGWGGTASLPLRPPSLNTYCMKFKFSWGKLPGSCAHACM